MMPSSAKIDFTQYKHHKLNDRLNIHLHSGISLKRTRYKADSSIRRLSLEQFDIG